MKKSKCDIIGKDIDLENSQYYDKDRQLFGNYIDMMSIYTKSKLRQLKIDYLLGEDKWDLIKKTTLGDLYERRRNI